MMYSQSLKKPSTCFTADGREKHFFAFFAEKLSFDYLLTKIQIKENGTNKTFNSK
nr:MAG TPA: hypothetical protein [Caudoviricetes sp.]